MKDDVRLIFSLIKQQTEIEGEEQEVGGWALHDTNQLGLKKERRAAQGVRETKAPSIVGRKVLCERPGENQHAGLGPGIWEPGQMGLFPEVRKSRRQQSILTLSSPLCLS